MGRGLPRRAPEPETRGHVGGSRGRQGGVSREVSPEPRTRGHTVWGLPRRVLEPGRKDSWGGVSREGSWSAGTVGMQGGVSREGSETWE